MDLGENKINNVKRFFKASEEVRSEDTEIFPGKKIAFVIKPLPVRAPNGKEYYLDLNDKPKVQIHSFSRQPGKIINAASSIHPVSTARQISAT